jgi:hypothetical protein
VRRRRLPGWAATSPPGRPKLLRLWVLVVADVDGCVLVRTWCTGRRAGRGPEAEWGTMPTELLDEAPPVRRQLGIDRRGLEAEAAEDAPPAKVMQPELRSASSPLASLSSTPHRRRSRRQRPRRQLRSSSRALSLITGVLGHARPT